MKILIVEDDVFHTKVIKQALEKHFASGLTTSVIKTEKEFRTRFEDTRNQQYDFIILDQMLPWTTTNDDEFAIDAPTEGPLRAGTRSYELVKTDPATKDVPVLFFTHLDKKAIPEGVPWVRKQDDPDLTALIAAIDQLVKRP